jgi:hypothetical protein
LDGRVSWLFSLSGREHFPKNIIFLIFINYIPGVPIFLPGDQLKQLCLQLKRRVFNRTIIFSRFSVEWETAETRLFR